MIPIDRAIISKITVKSRHDYSKSDHNINMDFSS